MGTGISTGYSGMVGEPNDQFKVEAKYPALLFKQHLTAYVEKIYGMIRDNLKKDINPLLSLCIQVSIFHMVKLTLQEVDRSCTPYKFLIIIIRQQDQQGSDQLEGHLKVSIQISLQSNRRQTSIGRALSISLITPWV